MSEEENSPEKEPWIDTWGFLSDEQIAENQRRTARGAARMIRAAKNLTGVEKEVWSMLWGGDGEVPSRESVALRLGMSLEKLKDVELRTFHRLRVMSKFET
jgi:DNA-directed RNA polymerase sigma subunit (sigma70/sigma32)